MGFTFIVALLALAAAVASAVSYVLAHNIYDGGTWKKDKKWAMKNPGAIANITSMGLSLLLVLITMMSGGDKDGGGGGDGGN